MRQQIQQQLKRLEAQHDIKILFASETGSRAWGYHGLQSDYDVRFIYVHRTEWYLSIEPKRDVLDNNDGESIDMHGWELRKTLQLFQKSNPTLLEWIHSPIVYQENEMFVRELRRLEKDAFNLRPSLYHYLKMAENNQAKGLLTAKQYITVLKPVFLCLWLLEREAFPLLNIEKLSNHFTRGTISDEVSQLIHIKKTQRPSTSYSSTILKNYFEVSIDTIRMKVEDTPVKAYNITEALNSLFQACLQEF
ncbi:nucleotidyltransferase domain-containing protein [Bacillus sp. 2205SS5-2]|uniref:nucleotidyltransferase domain-containing protein n=1 Tax=Bacillus sp. 2205SS5-2 TaxID=3109031 RepID=UPI0030043FBC